MLEKQEKQALYEEISRFATEAAGTCDDLDEQLEAAGIQHLNDIE